MSTNNRRIRILHVFAAMNRCGAETWIMYVMRHIDRAAFHFDFCVETERPCAYDQEIHELGGRIIPYVRGRHHGFVPYCRRLGALLREGGYDVVHAHNRDFTGVVLSVAARAGVRHRFAHLHSIGDDCRSTIPRVLYRRLMRRLVHRYATRGLGCSSGALESYFGPAWADDPRLSVVFYGVELDPFDEPVDRDGVRTELGLPRPTPLIIHVGRFMVAKNHGRLIDIFRAVHQRREDVHLVLVGKGELETKVQDQVQAYGLGDYVHFLGIRSDVPRLMKAADVMVMPSTREGMPVTMLEATAAGLPVVISDLPGTREANSVCCEAVILPMDLAPEKWANAVIKSIEGDRPDPVTALRCVRQSPFSCEASARTLADIYRSAVSGRRS